MELLDGRATGHRVTFPKMHEQRNRHDTLPPTPHRASRPKRPEKCMIWKTREDGHLVLFHCCLVFRALFFDLKTAGASNSNYAQAQHKELLQLCVDLQEALAHLGQMCGRYLSVTLWVWRHAQAVHRISACSSGVQPPLPNAPLSTSACWAAQNFYTVHLLRSIC